MFAVWILVWIAASIGLLGLILVAVILLLIARDTRRVMRERLERERLEREGPSLSARERDVLDQLEHGENGS